MIRLMDEVIVDKTHRIGKTSDDMSTFVKGAFSYIKN